MSEDIDARDANRVYYGDITVNCSLCSDVESVLVSLRYALNKALDDVGERRYLSRDHIVRMVDENGNTVGRIKLAWEDVS